MMRMAVAFLMVVALLLTGPPGLAEGQDAQVAAWDCPRCGTTGNTGNFCPECGAARPVSEPAKDEPQVQAVTIAEPQVQAGAIITFGIWEQDNQTVNGAEPIRWLVLEVQGSHALVISRYGLVQCRYAYHSNGQTWYNSSIRETLNQEFYNEAFTNEEKEAILITHLNEGVDQQDPSHPAAAGRVGEDTDDRIFILSYAEIIQYMPTAEDRQCYATESIRRHANYSEKRYAEGYTCWYWLRNPAYKNNASAVDWDGTIDACYMNHAYGVARPCCWVDLTKLGLSSCEEGES